MNKSPKPSKHFRLICWRLLYGLDVQKRLDRDDEIAACTHGRFDLAEWDQEKAQFPREWSKLLAKRQRRLNWWLEHGSVPSGWSPPDPHDPRRSANKPVTLTWLNVDGRSQTSKRDMA